MKSLLSIMLCTVLLLLTSCSAVNCGSSYSTIEISKEEKEEISAHISTLSYESIDASIDGNVEVAGVYHGKYLSYPSVLSGKTSVAYEGGIYDAIILTASDIFSTNDEYVYLFLRFHTSNSAEVFPAVIPLSANIENDVLSLKLIRENSYQEGDLIVASAFDSSYVYKIKSSSLSGYIEKLEINIVDSN